MKMKHSVISCLGAIAVLAALVMPGCGKKTETVSGSSAAYTETEIRVEKEIETTESASAEASSTETSAAESTVTETAAAETTAAETTAAESTAAETSAAESTATETSAAESTAAETAATENVTTEPETTEMPTTEAPTTQEPTTQVPTAAPETTAAQPESEEQTTAAQSTGHTNRRVFVGDSRVVMMQNSCGGNALDTWIDQAGGTYWWLAYTAVPQLQAVLNSEQIDSVIIMIGVNDCAAAVETGDVSWACEAEYAAQINTLAASYPNTAFYFCTVYYVDAGTWGNGAYHGWYNNEETALTPDEVNPQITEFNAAVCGNFYRIDVCSFVQNTGILSADGVHIIGDGAAQIYNYILGNLITY